MIVQITGKLKYKNINDLIIEANGIGYSCNISNNTFNQLPMLEQEITLLTFLHITENKHTLYGFIDDQERQLFKMLISVSGIGPKIGIQLLSKTNSEQLSMMIINSDVKMLSSLPGIGAKTAQRLIVELKDKFSVSSDYNLPMRDNLSDASKDAYNALLTLGYKSIDIERAIQKGLSSNSNLKTEKLIKYCLKELK